MPLQETSHRYQVAVLWPKVGFDSFGQAVVGDPVEIRVRWNDVQTEVLDKQGNTVALDATAVVDQDVAVGSQMWQGELVDWYGTGSAHEENELMEVKMFNATKDVKGRAQTRTVGLMRYRDSLNQ